MAGSEIRQRSKSILIRLSVDERAELDARAQAAGLSVGAYMRKMALGRAGPRSQRAPAADTDELRRLRGQLGKIGNNINQVAYHLNRGGLPEAADASKTLAELRALFPAIKEALGHDH